MKKAEEYTNEAGAQENPLRCGAKPEDIGPDGALITVIVPVYQTQAYLDRCVGSVLSQTYSNLEVLLIDDGSTDNCPGMCDAWAQRDSRIHVIHKTNEGLGMARNTGLDNARGEYICFVDSDDYIESDTVEKAHALAVKENADIVIYGVQSVGRCGEVVRELSPISPQTVFRGSDICTSFLPDLIDCNHSGAVNRNLALSCCVCLFSRELVRRSGFRFVSERDVISEDSYSLIGLYRHVRSLAVLKEAKYFYCANMGSLSHAYREDRYQKTRDFYELCLDMARQEYDCEEVHRSVSGLHLSLTIAAMKQIVDADTGWNVKKTAIRQIVCDDALQRALADVSGRTYGMARRILFRAMRSRRWGICYALLALQNAVKR